MASTLPVSADAVPPLSAEQKNRSFRDVISNVIRKYYKESDKK